MKKRLTISLITGALLGIVCIIGTSVREGGYQNNTLYLFAMWYNRVIIGLTVGFSDSFHISNSSYERYIRSGIIGLLVSLAFFLTSGFRDYIAFIAGIFYGLIIEHVASRYSK
ncbi:hypothetical protein ACFL50_04670 [Candidatus Latescibacterota bacterium]